jgi:hypothetical protein
MAFTHKSPAAHRHYAVAYSYSTCPFTSVNFSANEVSIVNSSTAGTTYYNRLSSYDLADGTSSSGLTSTSASKVSNWTGFNRTDSSSFSQSGSSKVERNYSKYAETDTSSKARAEGYTRSQTFQNNTGTATSGETGGGFENRFGSATERDLFGDFEQGQSIYSTTQKTFNRLYTDGSQTNGAQFITSDYEFGRTLRQANETSGDSTYSSTKTFRVDNNGNVNETITGTSITGSYEITPQKQIIATQFTQDTGGWYLGYSTETTSTSASYSSFSSDLLETVSSSYSFKTTHFNDTLDWSSTSTFDTYTTEYVTITEDIGLTYFISTIYGGAGFISGGITLDNQVVTGATTTSIYSLSISQPTNFNSFSYQNYLAAVTGGIDRDTFSFSTSDITYDGIIDTTVSIVTTSTSNIGDPLDFGRSSISANVFTSYTTSSTSYGKRTGNGLYLTVTNSTRANSQSTTYSGYTTFTANLTTNFFNESGLTTEQKVWSAAGVSTWNTLVYAGQSDSAGTRSVTNTSKNTSWSVQPEQYGSGFFLKKNITKDIITYDKGPQGGIQNKTSSDISGAVRNFRTISIADQVITTSTYTSPAATINITANSAKSSSYTISGGLALGLELKLNRYLTFFPDEKYGDIVSSIDSMQYSYSFDENGQSIIRFTSTGKYSTSGTATDGSSRRTTQSFSSELLGMAKVGLGAAYGNGQLTEPFFNYYYYNKGIFGGQNFTDREGVLRYNSASPPYTLYAFGSDSSSLISLDAANTSNLNISRSTSLPANSVIFAALSTYVRVPDYVFYQRNYETIDRKQ